MRYAVKLKGDAWVELEIQVEAEDEAEALKQAQIQGSWRIVGDVKLIDTRIKRQETDNSSR